SAKLNLANIGENRVVRSSTSVLSAGFLRLRSAALQSSLRGERLAAHVADISFEVCTSPKRRARAQFASYSKARCVIAAQHSSELAPLNGAWHLPRLTRRAVLKVST